MSFTTAIQKRGNNNSYLFNPSGKTSLSCLTALTILIACSNPALAKHKKHDKADGQLVAGLFDKKDKAKDDKKSDGKADNKATADKSAKENSKDAPKEGGKEAAGKEAAKPDAKAADKKEVSEKGRESDKKTAKANEEKPKKGGLFGKKPKKEDKVAQEDPKKEAEAEAKAEAEKEAAVEAKAKEEKAKEEKPEAKSGSESRPQADAKVKADADAKSAEAPPAYVPDAALISVLKDLSRALSLQEELGKIEDDNQRCVVAAAREVLAKALEDPQLLSNRILPLKDKDDATKNITPESWASGEMKVNDKFTGSLSAVWAKRINGLLNLTIAGDCKDRKAPSGQDVGQFVVIISARSPIESGFDIQTQSDVSYWFGKISGVAVESDCCQLASSEKPQEEAKADSKDSQGSEENEEAKKKSGLALQALLTPRLQKHYAEVSAFEERQRLLAVKADEDAKKLIAKAELEEKQRIKAEEEAKAKEAKAKEAKAKEEAKVAENSDGKSEAKSEDKSEKTADAKTDGKADGKSDGKTADSNGKSSETANAEPNKGKAADSKPPQIAVVPTVSPPPQPAYANSNSGWESPGSVGTARPPSLTANVVMPDRAVAGQFMTTSVLDGQKTPESNVELSFNGATLTTDNYGQAVFMVPEDATPGRSLHVALSSRPELAPGVIEVLQPLTIPSEHQIPRIDTTSSFVSPRGTITVTGHNFEGVADHNRVNIDGVYEGRAVAASPVMLKVALPPQNLLPGPHSLTVSTGGLRSNPGRFDLITTEIQTDPKEAAKDNLTKLIIKVLGTTNPVQLKLTNHSPDVIKISKGNELRLTTPGGTNNSVIVAVQRLKKGGYNVEATFE